MKLIDKSAVVAEIERRIKGLRDCHADTVAGYAGEISGLERLLSFLDTLEVKEVDLELITGWFDHVAQMADDRKTLNGEVMEDWAALDEIKCLAKNSSEFITKHYKTQKEE